MGHRTDEYWVTEFNYEKELLEELDIPKTVEIYDVMLREGNQTPDCIMRMEETLLTKSLLTEFRVWELVDQVLSATER